MATTDRFTAAELKLCLSHGEPGMSRLVGHLRPILHARVARVLLRYGRCATANLREEIQELIQEVFVALFEREAQALKTWDPALGMSLENYVGLVAERRVASILRDRGRIKRAAEEQALDDGKSELRDLARGPGSNAEDRQMLQLLLSRIRQSSSPISWKVFQMRFIQELEIDEISGETGMSPDAIYASVSRVRRLARHLRLELEGGPS